MAKFSSVDVCEYLVNNNTGNHQEKEQFHVLRKEDKEDIIQIEKGVN